MVGRAMTDIEKMHGTFETPDTSKEMAVLQGVAPVSTMQGYQKKYWHIPKEWEDYLRH